MIRRGFQNIYAELSFLMLALVVFSAMMGLPYLPAWNEFVTWFGTQLPGSEYSMTHFFGDARAWLISYNTIDFAAITRLFQGDFDTTTVFRALAFLVNIVTGFLPTIATLIFMMAMGFWYFLNNVLPLVSAFAYFMAGNFYNNHLPGIVAPIDWSAQSGWLGYPDQSFIRLLLPLPVLVG